MAPTIKFPPRPVFLFVAVGEVVAFAHGADSGQMRQAIRWDLLIYISYVMYMVVMVMTVVVAAFAHISGVIYVDLSPLSW